jgi:hypothetical protein
MEAMTRTKEGKTSCQEPHLSFRNVPFFMVNELTIPKGYRLATAQELEKSFNSNPNFNYELYEIGAAWAKGDKGETVCARIIDGKFTIANFKDNSFASYIAPVAFIRDESVAITRREEMAEAFKNAFRKQARGAMYELQDKFSTLRVL